MAAAGTFQQMSEDLCYSSENILLSAVKVNPETLALPLARQHLVARFPGALLPQGLFPYLGGKRNQKTERGPKPASERLPARAAGSGRGWQPEWALQSSGGPAGVRQCQGPLPAPLSAAPQQSSAAAR